ncbi:TIGR04222 domain-containing membrane protein [Nostoc sp. UHCC 0870]|uniref:TIGR04222 domain-containing membrane protein n=1 Tax=Nostoc sp. UHCC 0870 TaxID=2914041 RepID=UPI001EE070BE|nr:TIGR04222 domain-containing membrane protein [Nostoc sp. UHCC 0870]
MDLLLHNPIADMYGPQFLLFYGCVIAITLFVCWLLIQDPTKNQPLRLIPTAPDPYEIAYLRFQKAGVANVALFNLLVQGYLKISRKSITHAPNHPDISQLQPIEQQVFQKFAVPTAAITSLRSASESVESYCHIYEQQLHNEKLLYPGDWQSWQAWQMKVGLMGAMIISSLGGYKLIIALAKGRYNVGFLIIMAVVSIIWLFGQVNRRSRISYRGYKYLQQLEEAFAPLKSKSKNFGVVCSPLEYNLLIALFGMNALDGTTYYSYYQAFFPPMTSSTTKTTRTTSSSNSSSGSSCSSSSCSSSSCSSSSCGGGGGCGGCGG